MDTSKADKFDASSSSTSTPARIPKFRFLRSGDPVKYSTESTFSNYQYTWLLVNFARFVVNKEPFTLDIVQNGYRLWVNFLLQTEKDSSAWLYYKAFFCHRDCNDHNHTHLSIKPGIKYKLSIINKNKEKRHTIGK